MFNFAETTVLKALPESVAVDGKAYRVIEQKGVMARLHESGTENITFKKVKDLLPKAAASVNESKLEANMKRHAVSKLFESKKQIVIRTKQSIKEAASDESDWKEIAKRELEERLDVETELVDDKTLSGVDALFLVAVDGEGNNGESAWVVFQNDDDAEKEAVERVRQDLENEPELFNQDFISQHIEISDTDRNIIAGEEADGYIENIKDEDGGKRVCEEAGMLDEFEAIEEKIADTDAENVDELKALEKEKQVLVDEAAEKLSGEMMEDIEGRLKDPIQYFVEDNGIYTVAELLKQPFIRINVDDAAKEAVDVDGVAHFLDIVDSKEVLLPSGAVAYGTNKEKYNG